MPYKIYTYVDPYRLDQTDYWSEIKALPHFCSARTLVNGFKDVLQDRIEGLICDLDMFIRHSSVYKGWTDNIALRIRQHSILTDWFKQQYNSGLITKAFYQALTQNQNHFLDALRLFVELGISPASISERCGNEEQRLFVKAFSVFRNDPSFTFPNTPDKKQLHDVMTELAKQEVTDCKSGLREKKRCERAVKITQNAPDTIVVHGVHQFTPAQLRLIIDMEKMGFTIIFLFNYQEKYSKIYSSWNEIYSCFDVDIRPDAFVQSYQIPTMQTPSNALACAIGSLCQNESSSIASIVGPLHQLYQSVEFVEFANLTEYAHFVSNRFEEAMQKYDESRTVTERGNKVWDKSKILAMMSEQVYTANRDIHTLLNIYYPEYAKERHFLSYPIGQFFRAVYQLWSPEKGEITFDYEHIKECLNSNILQERPSENLLRSFCNLEIVFENITSYSEFERLFTQTYLPNYKKINAAKGTESVYPLQRLSIYNRYQISESDIKMLIDAIREINTIAKSLFETKAGQQDHIDFGAHFGKLEVFLKQRQDELVNAQERELISALQQRLQEIHPEDARFSGTLSDLREGLYFYLKQKDEEEQRPDWIVKNFEQIDGDILMSKRQFEKDEHKIYHFACLSDKDMNPSINDLLPWPLTEAYIREAYSPIDLQFRVYATALAERGNFLRYALFYGLFYNRCEARLSYVRGIIDEETEPYALLPILGLSPKAGLVESITPAQRMQVSVSRQPVKSIAPTAPQLMDMFLCPYRYFLDYVMEDKPIVRGDFLYQKFYENLLEVSVWQSIQKQPVQQIQKQLADYVRRESARLEPYFSFWKSTELHDLRRRAENYLSHRILEKPEGSLVPAIGKEHMETRELFGWSKFMIELTEQEPRNPYPEFERLAKIDGNKKSYYLPDVKRASSKDMQKGLLDFLNSPESTTKEAIASDWCRFCTHRNTCLESFLKTDE